MPDEVRLKNIEEKIDKLVETTSRIAVQHEQIGGLQKQVGELWAKYDALISARIVNIERIQAACPAKGVGSSLRHLWTVTTGVVVVLLLTLWKLLQG